MTKIKTQDLTGVALDWAVAKCENMSSLDERVTPEGVRWAGDFFQPSKHWSEGGPIIAERCIATYASGACSIEPKNPDYWVAEIFGTAGRVIQYGPAPLIAAMRAYVASKLGDEVDVPEALT